jgi:hypothetical protein
MDSLVSQVWEYVAAVPAGSLPPQWRSGYKCMRITTSDGGATIIQGVSPMPLGELGFRGEMLVRPAALLNLFSRLTRPIWVKTHFANIQPDGLPHSIPQEFTERAVYVVRDPRSVFLSFAKFFNFSMDTAADAMSNNEFAIGGMGDYASSLISGWSNHVSSWVSESRYPVHVVKYEDMVADTAKELTEVLEFLDIKVNKATVSKAVKAADLGGLKEKEKTEGFREHITEKHGSFFNGGTSWQDELGPKWIQRIETDHGKVMKALGYT